MAEEEWVRGRLEVCFEAGGQGSHGYGKELGQGKGARVGQGCVRQEGGWLNVRKGARV